MEVFHVMKPGFLTSVQDLGRRHSRRHGLAVAGAADGFALCVGNALIGNPLDEAGIEITLLGLELKVRAQCDIAVTGANLRFSINGAPISPWTAHTVLPGDTLVFSGGREGCRAYLCVAGGVEVPVVFGSRSTDLSLGMGGMDGRPLQTGDIIQTRFVPETSLHHSLHQRRIRPGLIRYIHHRRRIRVVPGAQAHYFSKAAWRTFLGAEYLVLPDSNRVGVRLKGPSLTSDRGFDIISEAVPDGAVQVPADGQPIVLLADRRTVGGYAKIATVATVDLPKLGQLRPGDTVRFHSIRIESAQQLLREETRFLRLAAHGWRP